MDANIEAELLAASHPLQLPGIGERRVLSPAGVQRLAESAGWPRWRVEAEALEVDVFPLRLVRNITRFSIQGQIHLLQASVALVGRREVIQRTVEMLTVNGVGRLVLLTPTGAAPELTLDESVAAAVRKTYPSCEVETRSLELRGGNPTETLRGLSVVAACLDAATEEQLLQTGCRLARVPLVISGVEEARAQLTTVLPGDPGVSLVYRPTHVHLERERAGTPASERAVLVAGGWLADQATGILLGQQDLARGRLRYADLEEGEMHEFALG